MIMNMEVDGGAGDGWRLVAAGGDAGRRTAIRRAAGERDARSRAGCHARAAKWIVAVYDQATCASIIHKKAPPSLAHTQNARRTRALLGAREEPAAGPPGCHAYAANWTVVVSDQAPLGMIMHNKPTLPSLAHTHTARCGTLLDGAPREKPTRGCLAVTARRAFRCHVHDLLARRNAGTNTSSQDESSAPSAARVQ